MATKKSVKKPVKKTPAKKPAVKKPAVKKPVVKPTKKAKAKKPAAKKTIVIPVLTQTGKLLMVEMPSPITSSTHTDLKMDLKNGKFIKAYFHVEGKIIEVKEIESTKKASKKLVAKKPAVKKSTKTGASTVPVVLNTGSVVMVAVDDPNTDKMSIDAEGRVVVRDANGKVIGAQG